jgi:hypothetical protein
VSVDDCREVSGAFAGDLPYDVLGDRRERDGFVHCEQRQTVAQTRLDQIVGDVAEFRFARGESRDLRGGEDPDERLRVLRAVPPGEPGEHQLAAGQVPAGVAQVRGHHATYAAVELVLAAEQPQPQRVVVQQCAQPHLVAADLSRCCRSWPKICRRRFHGETVRLPISAFRSNLQDEGGDQPTPSWFR